MMLFPREARRQGQIEEDIAQRDAWECPGVMAANCPWCKKKWECPGVMATNALSTIQLGMPWRDGNKQLLHNKDGNALAQRQQMPSA